MNHQIQISLEEINKIFAKYDTDISGYIEINELRQLMNDVTDEIGIPPPNDDELNQILSDVDDNHDKRISKEEFIDLINIIYKMKDYFKNKN